MNSGVMTPNAQVYAAHNPEQSRPKPQIPPEQFWTEEQIAIAEAEVKRGARDSRAGTFRGVAWALFWELVIVALALAVKYFWRVM